MTDETTQGFAALGLRKELVAALAQLGYEEPTPVQAEAIPALLSGRDVLGQAATGTGKTAAFALPILDRLTLGQSGPFETAALVLVPTRELAMQVAEAVHSYGRTLGVSVLPVYGGQDIGQQLRRLKRGVDVVIATPGRALDHLRRKTMKLDRVQTVVLDEADEMLDMGFAEDLETLLAELPEERQTALFSATLPPRIATIARTHLKDPVQVRIEPEKTTKGSLPRIRQTAYVVPRHLKEVALGRLLDVESPKSAIIFCRTRLEVERLHDMLVGHGVDAAALHGGMTQDQRDRVLKSFKAGKTELLVATDVAARGLDVANLSHVINFDLPPSPEVYVHRIGRTGRAGKEGNAVSLIEPREHRYLRNLERLTGQKVEVAQLPTLVDLRARRMELTRATVEETLAAGNFDGFRTLVEQLADRFDAVDVAAAAMSALHEALNPARESDAFEIPAFTAPAKEFRKERAPRDRSGSRERAATREREGYQHPDFVERPAREEKPGGRFPGARKQAQWQEQEPQREPQAERRPRSGEGSQEHGFARLFVGLGRAAGLRPGDLVGAIANEAGVSAREIGAIQINDQFSFVEVAEDRAEDVLAAMRQSSLRGRKVKIERDRGQRPRSFRDRE